MKAPSKLPRGEAFYGLRLAIRMAFPSPSGEPEGGVGEIGGCLDIKK